MEFNEKLQELRKQKGLTQEELAKRLYVSRTAISKWESGRGYPGIESLKSIAGFFSVTVDELLSPNEILTAAEEEQRQTKKSFRDTSFGLLDIGISLLLFLPLFSERADGVIKETSLLMLGGIAPYVKIPLIILVFSMIVMGILTLALQGCGCALWQRSKEIISLALGAALLLLCIISLQPYGAVFALALLAIKVLFMIKRP